MGLSVNLALAAKAIREVLKLLPKGSNTRGDNVKECVAGLRRRAVKCIEKEVDVYWDSATEAMIECHASEAKKAGCGNCGDHAALAFHLLRYWGVSPIELMKATNRDHMFVVIGRSAKTDPKKPTTWNKDAVVCDPWDYEDTPNGKKIGKSYAANLISQKMLKGAIVPALVFRYEGTPAKATPTVGAPTKKK